MFTLTMNPASEGDALILTWGEEQRHHALIDLGRTGDYRRARAVLVALGDPELFVITHIDADHIAGAVPLAAEISAPFCPADVWYNAHHHLIAARQRRRQTTDMEPLGSKQAEKLSEAIGRFGWQWNKPFGGGPVSLNSPTSGQLELAGGLQITLLSPDDDALEKLIDEWEDELAEANLRPFDPDAERPVPRSDREILGAINVEALAKVPFREDDKHPNGSSIAFLAEYKGNKVLFGADAHPSLVEASLRRLGFDETNKCQLACYKVAHHGSMKNTSPSLLRLLDCRSFAFSTNGTHHDHPDPETIARILFNDPDRDKVLHFNFDQPRTSIWAKEKLESKWRYRCDFPATVSGGLTIDLTI